MRITGNKTGIVRRQKKIAIHTVAVRNGKNGYGVLFETKNGAMCFSRWGEKMRI